MLGKEGQTLKDLYPDLLQWIDEVQPELTKPRIDTTQALSSDLDPGKTIVRISFTEPMRQHDTISTIFQDGRNTKVYIELTHTDHNLSWTDNGKTLQFEIDLPEQWEAYYFQFNWWGLSHPLISEKGVLVKYASYFELKTN